MRILRKVAAHVVKSTRRRIGRIHYLPDARLAKTCVESIKVVLQVDQLPGKRRVRHMLERRCKGRWWGRLCGLRDIPRLQSLSEEACARHRRHGTLAEDDGGGLHGVFFQAGT